LLQPGISAGQEHLRCGGTDSYIERIVVSSLVEAKERSGGKYQGVYHWDGKARALKYFREAYADLAGKLSVVIMGNYMGNWLKELKLRKVCIVL
jgi:hypothetical protein